MELNYETPPPYGSAPLLVRLAGIFLLVAAGLNFLNAIYSGIMTAIQLLGPAHPPPPGFPRYLLPLMQIVPGVLSLLVGGAQVAGGVQLLRRGRNAWGFGLGAAIASMVEFWNCPCCLLYMAAGVYTVVILCQNNVRVYLKQSDA